MNAKCSKDRLAGVLNSDDDRRFIFTGHGWTSGVKYAILPAECLVSSPIAAACLKEQQTVSSFLESGDPSEKSDEYI